MSIRPIRLGAVLQLIWLCHATGATLYVAVNSPNPAPPYADWNAAATNIQNAVDVSTDGDLILVSNGVYQTGSAKVVIPPPLQGGGPVTEWNRIAVLKAVTLQSVNGAAATVIQGSQAPDAIFGSNAIRCVYLTNGASLNGFTLSSGATRIGGNGGGIFSYSNATVINCTISNNSANNFGGGAYGGIVSNCTFIQNFATNGGGAAFGALNHCLIISNWASKTGGGSYSNSLNNCIVSNNFANNGGGVASSTLNGCIVAGNSSTNGGGGEFTSVLNDCILIGNSAPYGGGATGGTLNNCTIVSNSALLGLAQ